MFYFDSREKTGDEEYHSNCGAQTFGQDDDLQAPEVTAEGETPAETGEASEQAACPQTGCGDTAGEQGPAAQQDDGECRSETPEDGVSVAACQTEGLEERAEEAKEQKDEFSLEEMLQQEEPEYQEPTLKEKMAALAERLRGRLAAVRREPAQEGQEVSELPEEPAEGEGLEQEPEVSGTQQEEGVPDGREGQQELPENVAASVVEPSETECGGQMRAALDRVAMAVLVKLFWTGVSVRRLGFRIQAMANTAMEHGKNFLDYRRWRKAGGNDQQEGTAVVPSPAKEVVERFEQMERTAMIGVLSFLTGISGEEIRRAGTRGTRNRYRRAFARRCTTVFIPVASVLLLCAVLYSVKDYTLGVKVYIEGQEVATLKDEEEYETVATRVERYVSGITGTSYELGVQPTYQMALVNKKDFGASAALEEALLASADDVIYDSYGLYVDGELVAVHANQQELEELLQAMLSTYGRSDEEGSTSVEFVQDVRIEPGQYARNLEMSISDIQLLLTSTVQEEVVYTVQSGDLLGTIAPRFDMTVTQLKALNPDVDERRLQIGTPLTVSKATPFLTVKAVRTITYDESIPYETEVVTDSSKYTYETSVRTKGVAGVAEVTAQICEIDGMEISRLEVGRQVVSEPTTQVEVRGTKTPPATAPSGTLRSPVTGGTVTSRFGRRGSGTHTGIDIGLPSGTSIVAADGGTVTFAGWSGGYGYMVKISHGSSTQTWYAHCSALLVSAGQEVAKGQPIARVGSTGNSTGPHLHFEVRINGSAVNPAPYIGR